MSELSNNNDNDELNDDKRKTHKRVLKMCYCIQKYDNDDIFEYTVKKPIKYVKIEELNEYDCTICLNPLQRDTV